MSGQGAELPKESKEWDPSVSHTFSVNATPFEPSGGGSSFIQDGMQEDSSALASNALWAFNPHYFNMMLMNSNMNAMAQMSAMFAGGIRRYSGAPIVRASSPNVKGSNAADGSKKTDKNSLSAHAKPWSPTPESVLNQNESGDAYTQLKKGWTKVLYQGEMVLAPLPFRETHSLFSHFLSVRPLEKPKIQLKIFNYMCARCPTRSFFGRISCRGPDVTVKWIAGDVPPLRVAHLIEQVTGAAVSALFTESGKPDYEVWLEKPEKAADLVSTISGALWSCPMFHGYAVYAESEEAKSFLLDHVVGLKDSFPEPTPYPMCCVEASASTA